MISILNSFTIKNYRWLWFITTLVNTGSWTFTLVVTWQAYALTHSSTWSGAMMFATLIPNIIGAPIAGVLSDIMDRRRLMVWTALLQVTVTGILAILTPLHALTPVGLLGLALIFGFATSGMNVMLSSLVPVVVPSERLFNALSLQAMAQRGTELIGPVLASPLLVLYGPGMVYWLAAVLYLLASVAVRFLSSVKIHHPSGHIHHQNPFASLIEGFVYVRKMLTIAMLMSIVGLHCALTMAFMGMLPQFVKITLHGSSAFYGEVMSSVGLGSIIGTLLLAAIKGDRTRGSLYWITALISGGSLSLLAISRTHVLAIAAVVLVGASQATFMTLSLGYIQHMTENHLRGRVTSLYLVLAGGLMSLANLGYGALSNVIEPQWIMASTGILFMVIVAIYAALSRQFRSVSRAGVFLPVDYMPTSMEGA